MLEDRDYMRQPEFEGSRWRPRFHPRWSWTVALLVFNAAIFVIECIAYGYPPAFSRGDYFALSVDGIKHGYVWQFLTFQFMHAGLLHIFFNTWTIYFFGRHIEMELGYKRFLALYFSSGIIGGVFQILGGMLWPGHFGTAVVGASAGAMGLMVAFAVLHPDELLTIFIYFFPVTTRAKYIVWGFALLSVLCILFPQSVFTTVLGRNVSNAAHLGGMAMGWFFVRRVMRADGSVLGGRLRVFSKSEPKPSAGERMEKTTAEIVADDVDPILDKISAHGLQSLTAHERAVLEAARKKIAQR